MKNIPTTLLLAIASLLGCDSGSKAPPPQTSGPRFLALGDSYTIGESVDPSDRWPVQLARMLRDLRFEIPDPQIIATTGWTTDELSRGMDAANPRGPYTLVSLLIGVNNQFRGRDINEFRDQFAALLKRAIVLAGNDPSRVIVLSIPDWGVMPFAEGRDRKSIGEQIDQFNSVCREECEKQKVAFIDITPISRRATNDKELIASDGLHPSARQYRLWAEAVLPAARKALAER
jgi:lysophospholipase L1-like esterase